MWLTITDMYFISFIPQGKAIAVKQKVGSSMCNDAMIKMIEKWKVAMLEACDVCLC